MRYRIFAILIGFTVVTLYAGGTTPDALVAHALRQNPELIFYVAEINAAKGAVRTAGAIRNPEVNTQAGYKHSRDNSTDAKGDGVTFSVSLSQTFEYPGRVALREAIANHEVDLAGLHLQQFRATLAARVRTLCHAISSANKRSAAASEIAQRFEVLRDVIKQRPVAGVTPQLEAQIIATNTVILRGQEREATLAVETMKTELNQLCGGPVSAPLNLQVSDIDFTAPSTETLLQVARQNAHEIRIRQVELAQQGFKVALSQNERFPAIAVGPFYSIENALDRDQQVGVGISLPLPIWDRNAGSIATSRARQQQAKASLDTTVREVERRVAQNAAALRAKRAEINRLREIELPEAREATEVADQNYQRGSIPLAIYTEIQKQYLELLSVLSALEKDALQAGQELEILTGRKLHDDGLKP